MLPASSVAVKLSSLSAARSFASSETLGFCNEAFKPAATRLGFLPVYNTEVSAQDIRRVENGNFTFVSCHTECHFIVGFGGATSN